MFTFHKKLSKKLSILGLFVVLPAQAQQAPTSYSLPPVFVSSSHGAVQAERPPFSTTVITAEQIRQSGYTTVREVLSKLALVNVRTPLDGSRSASVDLRGFGETASANVVFVLDGVKLNDNEGVTPRYGSIPVSSIETIEVIRGGNSVAYGSGASGGVVRMTSKKNRERNGLGGEGFVSYGSNDTRELGATVYGSANGFSVVFNGAKESTNGYRDNSEASRDLGGLALDWQGQTYSAGAAFSAEGSKSRFPGSLNRTQFEQNPKQSRTPNDFGSFDRNTFRFYGNADYGSWGAGLRVSRRVHESLGSFTSTFGTFKARSEYEQDQISPDIRFAIENGPGSHGVRVGYHLEKAALRGFDAGSLESKAMFIEDDWAVNDALRIHAGSRYERSEQRKASGGATRDYSLQAHQLGASWRAGDHLTLFSKVARSFRIPNANENGFAGVGTTRVPFLEPQVADEVEVGLKTPLWAGELSAALFVMNVENELFFDPTIVNPALFINGLNANLDELRRQGVELKWNGTVRNLRMTAAYQYLDAQFRSGALGGGRVPLVAAHNLKVSTEYDWTANMSSEAIVGLQSNQRSGATSGVQIPGFGLLDFNWRYRMNNHSVVFQVQNVLDKSYYRTQFGPNGIYPELGRTFFINLQAAF